jgi:hypothetical protein
MSKTDTNWIKNPIQTKLQEVIFDLYDVYNGKITKLSREYARELAEKLEEVEGFLKEKSDE